MATPGVLDVSVAMALVSATVPVFEIVAAICSQSLGLIVVPPLPPPLTLEEVTATTGVPLKQELRVAVPPLPTVNALAGVRT